MEEIIKVLKENNKYSISNFGYIIKNKDNTKVYTRIANGYLVFRYIINGQTYNYLVHRLVAKYFVDNPYAFTDVHHIDGNKTNNRADNLEWIDCLEHHNKDIHIQTSYENAKPYMKPLLQYNRYGELVGEYESIKEAGRLTGINTANIGQAANPNSKLKSAGGYVWKYKSKQD